MRTFRVSVDVGGTFTDLIALNEDDGSIFNMDVAVYKKDIADDGIVKVEGLTGTSVLIAVDKHGNESKITKI